MARPTPVSVDVDSRELRRRLRLVEDGINDFKAVNLRAATIVANRSGHHVPRLSGTLAADIRASGTARAGIVAAGRASVPWAGPIHFGHAARNIEPQPFIYEALDDRIDQVIDAYEAGVADVIRKHDLD